MLWSDTAGAVWPLDDRSSGRLELYGAKAAGLHAALAAGLPVLPGFVVPAPVAARSLAAGTAALPARGRGGARRSA